MILLVLWILLLAFAFAKVEVQIEGPHGWAERLPTWRVEKHALLDVFWGGRPLTGYHAWVFFFMALVFHLPQVLAPALSWALEARIIGALAIFWIAEDYLWFVVNPAYGWRRFRKGEIAWHRHWIGPVPADYLAYLAMGAALLAWSYGR